MLYKCKLFCIFFSVSPVCSDRVNISWTHRNFPNVFYWQPQEPIRPHDDVIKWKHFPCYWTFVRGIHRSPVNSPHKGQWRGALMFSLICAWINPWVNNREAGDLRRHCFHYDVTVMIQGNRGVFGGCHLVQSLPLISWSGARRFHLRLPGIRFTIRYDVLHKIS